MGLATNPVQLYRNHAGTIAVTTIEPELPKPDALSQRLKLPIKSFTPASAYCLSLEAAIEHPLLLLPEELPVSNTSIACNICWKYSRKRQGGIGASISRMSLPAVCGILPIFCTHGHWQV